MPAVRCWPWGVLSSWLASRDLRYSALQLLGESGACGFNYTYTGPSVGIIFFTPVVFINIICPSADDSRLSRSKIFDRFYHSSTPNFSSGLVKTLFRQGHTWFIPFPSVTCLSLPNPVHNPLLVLLICLCKIAPDELFVHSWWWYMSRELIMEPKNFSHKPKFAIMI